MSESCCNEIVVADAGGTTIVREPDITFLVETGPPERIITTVSDAAQVVVVETTTSLSVTAPGPAGPPGPTGGFTSHFHTQSSPSSAWVVNHNLGRRCHVTVYVPDGREVEADVVHNSNNQVAITFASPVTGTALIA